MPEEKIRVSVELDPASVASLDAQLQGVAARFKASLGISGTPAGGGAAAGGAPTGSGTPGRLATSAGGAPGAALGAVAAQTATGAPASGAAQAPAQAPPGTAQSGFLRQAAAGGYAGGVSALNSAQDGAFLSKSTAASVGLGVTQGVLRAIPVVGELASAYFQEYRRGIEEPIRRGADRIAAQAGELARYGINLTDKQLEAGASRVINQERAALSAERRARKIAGNVGVDTIPSASSGLSWIGG